MHISLQVRRGGVYLMNYEKGFGLDYYRFFTSSTSLFCVMGADGYFKELSVGWEKALDRSIDELKSSPFIEFIHPDDRESTVSVVKKFSDRGEFSLGFENRYLHKNGTYRWFRWNPESVVQGDYVFATAHDVTEIKRQRELIDTTGSNAKVGGWEVYIPNSKVIWTRELYAIHELSQDKFVPTVKSLLEFYSPSFRSIMETNFNNAQYNAIGWDIEAEIITSKARKLWVRTKAEVEIDNGKVVRIFGILRNIQEKKMAEFRESLLLEEAERSNKLKDDFIATLSHELRTPLTTILAWSQVLGFAKLKETEVRHAVAVIEQCANIQGQLIEDLLDVTRIRANRLHLDLKKLELIGLVQKAIKDVDPVAEKKSVKVELVSNIKNEMVLADAARIHQILWNLLNNAIKFSVPQGKVGVLLSNVFVNGNKFLEIKISDNGVGIDPEFMPKIFDHFTQADSSSTRHSGGLGLGLAIVRSLVEMHRGTIAAESLGTGHGTTFTVLIPQTEPEAQRPGFTQNIRRFRSLDSSLAQDLRLDDLRIVLVEDNEIERDAMSLMLSSLGANVRTAGTAVEGLREVQESVPDILISDISMPGEDGYSLINKVRTYESAVSVKGVPALALTAFAGAEDVSRILSSGFTEHLAKPVDVADMAFVLNRITRKAQDFAKA